MSNPNVFGWIRDSVRRAVLLGFSDAVEQVGTLEGNQNINPHLLSMLKQNPAALGAATGGGVATAELPEETESAKPRRRLGRSLDDLRGDSHKS
ncbi:MAG: hypothetical protein K8U03_17670 [Planctomycetia bacterium]|nr:hypothetical protein [Planctomycetia bacterium]